MKSLFAALTPEERSFPEQVEREHGVGVLLEGLMERSRSHSPPLTQSSGFGKVQLNSGSLLKRGANSQVFSRNCLQGKEPPVFHR